jgi:hypothetical protein
MNQKKKIKGSTYLAAAHLAEVQAGPTPSPAAQPTYPFGRLQPRAGKQLGGALGNARSAAASSTYWMKAAAPGRL